MAKNKRQRSAKKLKTEIGSLRRELSRVRKELGIKDNRPLGCRMGVHSFRIHKLSTRHARVAVHVCVNCRKFEIDWDECKGEDHMDYGVLFEAMLKIFGVGNND